MHKSLRKALRIDDQTTDKEFLKNWNDKKKYACKPCWELKYCPYGPFVEESPLLPVLREESIAHNEYLKESLKTGILGSGAKITEEKRELFEKWVAEFDPDNSPESIPEDIAEMSCNVFGHICPVIYVAEPFTETEEERRRGRHLPFKLKMRVVRRDNYTCQECGAHLKDNEVEFDHIIPIAKGGSSEEHNIRLTCYSCNRGKSDKVNL